MTLPPKPRSQAEILTDIVRTSEMKPTTAEDWYAFLGQSYHLTKDEQTFGQILGDPDLAVLLPTISHLLRTSNLDRKTVQEMKLRIKRALRIQLMVKRKPSLVSQAKFDAMVNFCYAAVEDTIQGWRGRLITERIKIHKLEAGTQKRRKILGIF